MIHGLLAALQEKRFRYAADLPIVATLVEELTSFELRVNERTGHDTYEAWREGVHDDLVLAVAIACWYAERELEARYQRDLEDLRWGDVDIPTIGPSY